MYAVGGITHIKRTPEEEKEYSVFSALISRMFLDKNIIVVSDDISSVETVAMFYLDATIRIALNYNNLTYSPDVFEKIGNLIISNLNRWHSIAEMQEEIKTLSKEVL